MRIRRRLYEQLAVVAWKKPGLSPLNAVICAIILLNLMLQIAETEPLVRKHCGELFRVFDWVIVLLFSTEYVARVWVAGENPRFRGVRGRLRYMVSFFSLVDLISILPAYLSLGAVDSSAMRGLRLVRVLRFARFGAFSVAFKTITEVLMTRIYEFTVSLIVAVCLLLVASTLMFFAEGSVQPEKFGSIPRALWWGVVTMTTVGYGDTIPQTAVGRVLAAVVTMSSIAVIAIPTGIFAASFSDVVQKRKASRWERAAESARGAVEAAGEGPLGGDDSGTDDSGSDDRGSDDWGDEGSGGGGDAEGASDTGDGVRGEEDGL